MTEGGDRDKLGRGTIWGGEIENCIHQNHVFRVRPNRSRLLPEYLSLYLGTPEAKSYFLRAAKQTTGIASINLTQLSAFPVTLPPVKHQHRIATVLAKADAVRRKREEGIRLTEELLRSTFLEMFGDPVANPKGWSTLLLGAISGEMTYGTNQKCSEEEPASSLPVLRIPNILHGRIDWTELKYASVAPREAEQLLLAPGDLLFVRTNGNPEYIGRCATFSGDTPALFASYLIRVRLKSEAKYRPEFVRYVMTMPSYRSLMAAEARTTAGNYNISTQGLRRLKLIAPPLDQQDRFLEFATKTNTVLAKREAASREAASLFNSLVQNAFQGEL